MKKKTLIALLCIFAVIAIIGIVLVSTSATPYLNCKYWLSDDSYISGYLYAHAHIDQYATMYFTGIAMVIAGPAGLVLTLVVSRLKKQEMPRNDLSGLDFD